MKISHILWLCLCLCLVSTETVRSESSTSKVPAYKQTLEYRYRMAVKTVLIPTQSQQKRTFRRQDNQSSDTIFWQPIIRLIPKGLKSGLLRRSLIRQRNIQTFQKPRRHRRPRVPGYNPVKFRSDELFQLPINVTFEDIFNLIPSSEMEEMSSPETLRNLDHEDKNHAVEPQQVAVESVKAIAWVSVPQQFPKLTAVNRLYSLSRDLWVTLDPDLQDFCRSERPTPLRLAQYLGLPPVADMLSDRQFIHISVPITGIFRPCLGNRRGDGCRLTSVRFSRKSRPPLISFGLKGQPIRQEEYPWFYNMAAYSFIYHYWQSDITGTFPWTRLGYTFDWNRFAPGADEFVVPRQSKVVIYEISDFKTFCSTAK